MRREAGAWRAESRDLRLYAPGGITSCVCYHIPTGNLHLLEPVPARILDLLVRQGPMEPGELVERLEEDFEFEAGIDLVAWVGRILGDLVRQRLVSSIDAKA